MKKNSLYGLIILFFCLAAFSGCQQREIANRASKGKNIICFGDSITFGYGANPGDDFPSQLAKLVSMPVLNEGISGDTSVEGLQRIQASVLDKDPYLVLIEFSGNDFIKNVPEAVTMKNIEKMIERIQAGGAMVAIVDISAGMFMQRYRALLAKIAERKKAIFIPSLLDKIITNPSMKSDFLHPNAAGYKEVAGRIRAKIAPFLKNSR